MSEKIIFLDFDGVATTKLSALATGSAFALSPTIMRIIDNICEASGAKLVCSSNRATLDKKSEIEELLRNAGFDPKHLHEDWSCSYENTYSHDKNESAAIRTGNIVRWVLEPKHEGAEFVVIDDLKLLVPNFVHITNINNGIQFEDIQKLCELLSIDLNEVTKAANPKAPRFKFDKITPQ